jgi:hypothetical protein
MLAHVRAFNHGVDTADWAPMLAGFAWEKGGTGRLELEHDRGTIARLTVVFD